MKVYVLSVHRFSDWELLGIFSSRERAEEARTQYDERCKRNMAEFLAVNPGKYPHAEKAYVTRTNDLEEYELDCLVGGGL